MQMTFKVTTATAETAARTNTRATSAAEAKATNTSNSTESAVSKSPSSGAGPAATVSISNDARTKLRAAGVSTNEIARINLKDKNAVNRAIQRARMQHNPTSTTAQTELKKPLEQVASSESRELTSKNGPAISEAATEGEPSEAKSPKAKLNGLNEGSNTYSAA